MLSYTEREVLPNNVFVFGCGGTGSRTIPPLVQLLKSQTWILNPNLFLIDGDEVEPKNCSRQHFIEQDVGRNKAEVLAERYSKGFGVELKYYPRFFDGETNIGPYSKDRSVIGEQTMLSTISNRHVVGDSPHCFTDGNRPEALRKTDLVKMYDFIFDGKPSGIGSSSTASAELFDQVLYLANDVVRGSDVSTSREGDTPQRRAHVAANLFFKPCVVILCVDSAEARRKILSQMMAFDPNRKIFVIDAGNEDIYGQVSFFRTDHRVPLMDNSLLRDFTTLFQGDSYIGGSSSVDGLKRLSSSVAMEYIHDVNNYGFGHQHQLSWSQPRFRVSEKVLESLSSKEANSVPGWEKDLDRIRLASGPRFNSFIEQFPEMSCASGEIPILPMPDRFYDELVDGESTRSCADLDQTLAINNIMGACIINVVNNLVYSLPFTFNTIRVSLNGGYAVEHMSHYWFKNMLLGNDARYSNSLKKDFAEGLLNITSRGGNDVKKAMLINFLTSDKVIEGMCAYRNAEASQFSGYYLDLAQKLETRSQSGSSQEKEVCKEVATILPMYSSLLEACYRGQDKSVIDAFVKSIRDHINNECNINILFSFVVRGISGGVFLERCPSGRYGQRQGNMMLQTALADFALTATDLRFPLSELNCNSFVLEESLYKCCVDLQAAYVSKGEIPFARIPDQATG